MSDQDDSKKKKSDLHRINKWVNKLEKKYDTRLIFLLGEFNDYLYDMFIRQLLREEKLKSKNRWITIVIHTDGGDADVALKISDVMRKHKCKFRTIVPINAGSAGAHVGMSANELILGRYAYLTPFDTVMGRISLKNIEDFDLEKCIRVKDYNRVKEALHEKHIATIDLNKMFGSRYSPKVINKIHKLFIGHCVSHDNPVEYSQIIETGVTHVKQKKLCKWYHKLVGYFIDHAASSGEKFIYSFYASCV